MLHAARSQAAVAYLATSKPWVYAERILDHFSLAHYFDKVYGAELDGRYDDEVELIAHLLATEQISS